MPEPAITVAMSVFNGARFLPEAIESVLGQDFGGFEFLIVDDGSTDSSLTSCRTTRARMRGSVPSCGRTVGSLQV
ncbi:glycosyltransferase family 2 protein [Novosphingobium panipatense]